MNVWMQDIDSSSTSSSSESNELEEAGVLMKTNPLSTHGVKRSFVNPDTGIPEPAFDSDPNTFDAFKVWIMNLYIHKCMYG